MEPTDIQMLFDADPDSDPDFDYYKSFIPLKLSGLETLLRRDKSTCSLSEEY